VSDQPQYPRYPGDDAEPSEPQTGPAPGYGQAPPPSYGQAPPAYGQSSPQGFPPPPGYGYPQQGYGYPPPRRTSTKAVVGLVLGIVSILFCYLGVLIGPAAIMVSILARREIDDAPQGAVEGRGMAIAGLVTGIIGTIIWAVVIALIVVVSFE
jgi:hypothetical protein